MSRIGLKPVEIPEGVTISLNGQHVTVKGPKGELSRELHPAIKVNVGDTEVTFERPSDHKEHRSLHGTTRSVVNNMVEGVTKGYEKGLEDRKSVV